MLRTFMVILLLVVAPAAASHAQNGGFGVSQFAPGFDECLSQSDQIVIGVIRDVVLTTAEENDGINAIPVKVLRISCRMEVAETLRGAAAEGTIELWQERKAALLSWTPKNGELFVMYLRKPVARDWPRGNVFYGQSIATATDPLLEAVREVCTIRELESVHERAEAVERLCLSENPTLQIWAISTLCGTGEEKDVSEQFSQQDRISILRDACFARRHRTSLVLFFDEKLRSDERYERSAERYEMFWGMLRDCLVENHVAGHNEFMRLTDRLLPAYFPERADDCLLRLAELAADPDWPYRGSAMISMRAFYSRASEELQDKVVHLARMYLTQPLVNDSAAILLGSLAEREATLRGKVSPRLQSILDRADTFDPPVLDRLRRSQRTIAELLTMPVK